MLKAEHPFSLILFGASGHLARIKIFPALYYLALKKRLPDTYAIVGYARTPMTDAQFREHVASSIKEFVPEVNAKVLEELLGHCYYQAGQYDSKTDFESLRKKLEKIEQKSAWVRMAYLSIPPSAFQSTITLLFESGVHNASALFRCILEKPMGHDMQSFESIRTELFTNFKPEEIYILDHYLGKEAVRNIYYLRHANPVIERLMKSSLISSVQIAALESDGLEGRAGYFDAVGTLRDMFQSHLIQMSALLAMRLVSDMRDFKATRLDAIRKFYLPPASSLSEIVMQGQYEAGQIGKNKVIGYSDEKDVKPGSRAATYIAAKLMTRSSRWEGVPFFLRSGKRLKAKETRVSVGFNESPTMLGKSETQNRLDIILQGEAGLKLTLQTKIGGSEPKFRPLVMEDPLVCMGDCFDEHSILLLEAINGLQQWFLDPEEVRACWLITDPLQKYLDDPSTPLHMYPAGSAGPAAADDFIAHERQKWF